MKRFINILGMVAICTAARYAHASPVELDPAPVAGENISVRFGAAGQGAQSPVPAAAASGDSGYLVAWSEFRASTARVMAMRVSEDGVPIDTTARSLTSFPFVQFFGIPAPRSLHVVHSKGGFVVTWVDATSFAGQYVRGVRVKEDGTVVDTSPLLLGEVDEAFSWNIFGGDHVNPTLNAVAASDDALLVLTEKSLDEGAGGFNQSLTANVFTNLWGTGAPTKTSAILSSVAASRPVVTSDGKDFFASWAESGALDSAVVSRISTSAAVTWKKSVSFVPRGAAVSSGGKLLLAGEGTAVFVDASVGTVGTPFALLSSVQGMVARGSGFFVVDAGGTGTWLDANAQIVNACAISAAPALDPVFFALGKTTVLGGAFPMMTGSSAFDQPLRVSVRAQTTCAEVAAPSLARSSNAQVMPAIAFDGEQYLAVWVDDRGPRENDPMSGQPTFDPTSVFAVRIKQDGSVGVPTKIHQGLLRSASRPAVHFDGKAFFVAWHEVQHGVMDEGSITAVEIPSSRTATAITTSAPLRLTSEVGPMQNGLSTSVALSSDGDNRLVIWTDGVSQFVYGVRVSIASNAAMDTTPITLAATGQSFNFNAFPLTAPRVVFDGTDHFVIFSSGSGFGTVSIYGVLLKKGSAEPSPQFVVHDSIGMQFLPTLATNGKGEFLVAWADVLSADGTFDVRGKLLRKSEFGRLETKRSLSLGVASGDQGHPTVAYANDGVGYAVVWSDLRDASSHRLFVNYVSSDGRVFEGESGTLLDASSRDDVFPSLTSGPEGQMGLVYSHFDPRSMYGDERVYFATVSSGVLKGGACTQADECASRFCVGGVCCEEACEGACATCAVSAETRGTCGLASKGTVCGENRNYVCDGAANVCGGRCESNDECATGFHCTEHVCVGAEVAGCLDAHTLSSGYSCGAYLCIAGTCATSCASADDCLAPQVCDFGGRCVNAPWIDTGSQGCSTSNVPSEGWGCAALFAVGAFAKWRRSKRRGYIGR